MAKPTKRLSSVSPRYVAQQESYLMRPTVRPQAAPVDAAPEPSRVDPSAARLREISEAMAAGSRALTDFFTMEKSFEETNRMENQIRGQLGLPPADGRGSLKYGSRAGYMEGKGILKGQQALVEVQQGVNEYINNLDLDNLPEPSEVRAFVDDLTGQAINMTLGSNPDPSELRGASPLLTQAKLENRVKALAGLQAAEERAQLQHASQFASNHLDVMVGDMRGALLGGGDIDPAVVRSELGALSSFLRDTYGVNRDVGTLLVLENFHSQMSREGILALAPGGDMTAVMDMEEILVSMVRSLELPDESGISISNIKAPEVQQAVKGIQSLTDNFRSRAEFVRSKGKELEVERIYGDAVKLYLAGEDPGVIRSQMLDLVRSGELDPSALEGLRAFVDQQASGYFSATPQAQMNRWMLDATAGRMTPVDIVQLSIKHDLSPREVTLLNNAYGAMTSTSDYAYTQMQRRFATEDRAFRLSDRERGELLDSNKTKIQTLLDREALDPNSPEGEMVMAHLRQVYTTDYMQTYEISPEDLDLSVRNLRMVYQDVSSRVRSVDPFADEAAQKAQAKRNAAWIRYQTYPQYSSVWFESKNEVRNTGQAALEILKKANE